MSGKWKAAFLMVVMFGLGVVSGSAWQTYRNHHFFPPRIEYADRRIKRMMGQLNLTPGQEQEFRAIFQKAHVRATQINTDVSVELADIHRDSVVSIRAILNPDQRIKFEKLHRHYHTRYARMPDEDVVAATTTVRAGE